MKDKDFEQWLTREEGILKVEKGVDDWCENDVFVDELYKRYRQLKKDKEDRSKSFAKQADIIKRYEDLVLTGQEANAELEKDNHKLRDKNSRLRQVCKKFEETVHRQSDRIEELYIHRDKLLDSGGNIMGTLKKANAELLAALEHIRGDLYHINNKRITDDFRIELKAIAQKAITKHKGESDGS